MESHFDFEKRASGAQISLMDSTDSPVSAEAARERAAVQAYLATHQVNEMLCNMLELMCVERPDNPQQFMVDWVCSHFPSLVKQTSSLATRPPVKPITEEEEEAEDAFETEEQPVNGAPDMSLQMAMTMSRNKGSRRRQGVSAESVDPSAILSSYERKVHPKTAETRAKLKTLVQSNFLFSTLDADQLTVLLDAMFEVETKAGSTIIRQGDEADNFYVIFSGSTDIYISKDGAETLVDHFTEGDAFGELALLYGAPRAATVKAATDCTLYAVDRFTFKFIMMETTTTKRATHTAFLEGVPLLASLTANERQTIADALKPVAFADGETIIRQHDEGSTFFILEKGHVVCTAEANGVVSEVGRLSPGQYFGEVALLTNRPRLASVTAAGEVSALELDRRTFTRVLGPLTDVLKRNMAINAYIVAVGE